MNSPEAEQIADRSYIAPTIAIRPSADEVVERPALLGGAASTHAHDVAAGHGVDERLPSRRAGRCSMPRRCERVDRLAGCRGRCASRCWQPVASAAVPAEPARSTAAVTAPHRVCPITRISFAPATAQAYSMLPEHLPARDVAGDADAEDVAHPQVEDQLGGRAGVDAAEHDGQRVLRRRPWRSTWRPRSRVRRRPVRNRSWPSFRICSTCSGVSARLELAGGVVHVLGLVLRAGTCCGTRAGSPPRRGPGRSAP